jgi:hypothetical protein
MRKWCQAKRIYFASSESLSEPIASCVLVWLAGDSQQMDQLLLLAGRQMPHLFLVHGHNLVIHLPNQLQTCGRDPRFDNPAIARLSLSHNQLPFFQTFKHPRHIGPARNHALAQLHRWKTAGRDRFQDPQHIVLLCRDLESSQTVFLNHLQQIVCTPKMQEDSLFGRIELDRFTRHRWLAIICYTLVRHDSQ